jgi:hypothetical protein
MAGRKSKSPLAPFFQRGELIRWCWVDTNTERGSLLPLKKGAALGVGRDVWLSGRAGDLLLLVRGGWAEKQIPLPPFSKRGTDSLVLG